MDKKLENTSCAFTATISLIGGRWKSIILFLLADHTRRFGEIVVRMPSISRKVLTEQLKELEADGLITRKKYKEMPPRVEYSLTDLGKSLKPILKDMATWGHENVLNT
ncbi:helix-turn-helix domain-containing protein [Flavobacterium pectinovorum]|uniref:winged helix-turn-helix transcriptional regulator n=1 Tax=Flavobacterium pectinovorum TaxID=29533 RepID=UPI00265FB372|nr:helix-turn-helix domain-containing protein [Flavobacterium pectinovorum]WKL49592.1 helix-turn-helix domain-containing protein [Flavobacterium pectinovorum]